MSEIINGVDVSECKNFIKDFDNVFCNSEKTLSCKCSKNKDCYYKQLKRLEQKNEKLKQVANDSIIEQEKLMAKVNELQAENERLKEENEELKTLKDMYFTYYKAKHDDIKGEFFAIKKENERLKEEINKLGKKHEDYCNIMYWQMKEQMDKYRQTLKEIREIARNEVETRMLFADKKSFCDFNIILAKINEVGAEE